ncbi:MAG: methionyl-tRNA formyltransferase [Gammaproteobacteria bacterium]|nr:methionyl-tRNA formyltransferase [Gammaproteobacteria bacterium]
MKLIFAGTPEFGLPCLEALHASQHQVTAIYTQPDRPSGRGRSMQPSAIKEWGLAHQLPIYQPENFKTADAIAQLEALAPDLIVVIAYGLILPTKVLAIPRFGCVNVHASILPRWRGASPIQQAILAGDRETGVAIMQMDAGMDTGPYYALERCAITPDDTSATLHQRLSLLAPEPLIQTIDAIAKHQATPVEQTTDHVTYAPKIKKQDAAIDWHQPATVIDCQIRGYYPWPIAFTHVADMTFRIHHASIVDQTSTQAPGTILAIDANGMLVNTGQGAILIDRIQCPGGRPISIADYLNAKRQELSVGTVLA